MAKKKKKVMAGQSVTYLFIKGVGTLILSSQAKICNIFAIARIIWCSSHLRTRADGNASKIPQEQNSNELTVLNYTDIT